MQLNPRSLEAIRGILSHAAFIDSIGFQRPNLFTLIRTLLGLSTLFFHYCYIILYHHATLYHGYVLNSSKINRYAFYTSSIMCKSYLTHLISIYIKKMVVIKRMVVPRYKIFRRKHIGECLTVVAFSSNPPWCFCRYECLNQHDMKYFSRIIRAT